MSTLRKLMTFILLASVFALNCFSAEIRTGNLLPNSSFEKEENKEPANWSVRGAKGQLEEGGKEGKYCVSLTCEGEGQSGYWYTESVRNLLEAGKTYLFSFYVRQIPGTSGGCIISGPSFCNRDFQATEEWEKNSFVFVAPGEMIEGSFMRVGHFSKKGKIFFDDVSLMLVNPVFQVKDGIALGDGESIEGNVYTFSPDFASSTNYSRPFFGTTAYFNTWSWTFNPGSYLTYKQEIKGIKQIAAKVEVDSKDFTGEDGIIEASLDGENWEEIGKLTKRDKREFRVPEKLFPAKVIYIRINSDTSKPGNFYIHEYKYTATLEKTVSSFKGSTKFEVVLPADAEQENKKVFYERLKELKTKLESIKVSTKEATEWKENIAKELSSVDEKLKKETFATLSKTKEMDVSFNYLDTLITSLKEDKLKSSNFILYVVSPVTNKRVLPLSLDIPGEISDEIKIIATPGEYEPASFVLRPGKDIEKLTVEPGDLKNKEGKTIFSSNINIKVVKCWYQSGDIFSNAPINEGERLLTPELLLNDDSLIKADYVNKENYVKLLDEETGSETYFSISTDKAFPQKIIKLMDRALKDSPRLLPVNIDKNTNKQFWVTVKVPEDATPDIYEGKIELRTKDEILGSLKIKLKVLPFKLASPKTYYDSSKEFISSMYVWEELHPKDRTSVSDKLISQQQLRSELNDLYIHGVTNPLMIWSSDLLYNNEKLFRDSLQIRKEVGITGPLLLGDSGDVGAPQDKAGLDKLKENIKKALAITKDYNIPEVYFYGIDESTEDRLAAQRLAWGAVHEAGGKIVVSGQIGEKNNFVLMGDIQDMFVCYGLLSKIEAEKWHSKEHLILSYANPQGGLEAPETYRRNFGLLLWKANYDGACTYCYIDPYFGGHPWNDFYLNSQFRVENMVYPTVDGVIDTIQIEGYREGIDDIKYAVTLREEINKAKKSKEKEITETALEAEKYLEQLDVTGDLDIIRLNMIRYILKLKGVI